jgi:hypothetical protein
MFGLVRFRSSKSRSASLTSGIRVDRIKRLTIPAYSRESASPCKPSWIRSSRGLLKPAVVRPWLWPTSQRKLEYMVRGRQSADRLPASAILRGDLLMVLRCVDNEHRVLFSLLGITMNTRLGMPSSALCSITPQGPFLPKSGLNSCRSFCSRAAAERVTRSPVSDQARNRPCASRERMSLIVSRTSAVSAPSGVPATVRKLPGRRAI